MIAPLTTVEARRIVVAMDFGDVIGRQKFGIFRDDLRRHETRLALTHRVDHHRLVGFDVGNGERVRVLPGARCSIDIGHVPGVRLGRPLIYVPVGTRLDHVDRQKLGEVLAPNVEIFSAGLVHVLGQRPVDYMHGQLRVHHRRPFPLFVFVLEGATSVGSPDGVAGRACIFSTM